MKYLFLSILFSSFLINTSTAQNNNSVEIDIQKNMDNFIELTLSDFADDIDYIPLETSSRCLIDQNAHFLVCEDFYLIGEDHQDLRKFNLDGKFIGIFANNGRGPGEYQIITNLYFDADNQNVILFDGISNRLLYYNKQGVFEKSFDLPIPASNLHHLSGSTFIGESNYQLVMGSIHYSYFLFDSSGKVEPLYPQKENLKSMEVLVGSIFFKSGKLAYYMPPFCDTLYQFNMSQLVRKTHFKQGKLFLPQKYIYDHRKFRNEFKRYIFNLRAYPAYGNNVFITYYHKGKPNVGICNPEKGDLKMINLDGRLNTSILNDLDGGLEFEPVYNKSKNSWYKLVWVDELKSLLEEDRFLQRKIKHPDKRKQLKEFIENLSEEDNPVIIITKGRSN